jgi:hypothetical protein
MASGNRAEFPLITHGLSAQVDEVHKDQCYYPSSVKHTVVPIHTPVPTSSPARSEVVAEGYPGPADHALFSRLTQIIAQTKEDISQVSDVDI